MMLSGCGAAFAALALALGGTSATAGGLLVSEVAVNVASNTKIGSVRSGMLCTPDGKLRWSQIAVPTGEAMRKAITAQLQATGISVVEARSDDARRGEHSMLTLAIEGASIKVCHAWKGLGNAPKGNGNLRLTWHWRGPAAAIDRMVTMDQELAFDKRDPRVDPAVILDAISVAAARYARTAGEVQ